MTLYITLELFRVA